ncbi:MAG: glycogen synthase GlgA [Acidobacteriota bacterium]
MSTRRTSAAAPRSTSARRPSRPSAARTLRILVVASEMQPFSKTGGLADVVGALPRALGRLGHEVTVVTPRYRGVDAGPRTAALPLHVAGYDLDVGLHDAHVPGARVIFVDCPPLYDRPGLYNENNVDYDDNALRFAVLSIAAVEWAASAPAAPSVVHAHDWQAGLTPVYLRRFAALHHVPCVFTVHNLAYQGVFDKAWVPRLGLSWDQFRAEDGFEFYDRLSFLKAGVMLSDLVTTVSPTYAQEIQRPEYGYGFDGIMRARRHRLVGILNGIDHDEWNPSADPYLPEAYGPQDLGGKRKAKRALLEAFTLPADEAALARPVVGMVGRMVHQKGLDLIAAVVDELADRATLTVIGTGDAEFEAMWRRIAAARPDRVGAHIGFDERRAHLVEAGADIFLMPSRYEPCGLNQMYSMRYGTVPVVRAVGGLVDTVRPYNPRNGQGTGFLFSDYHPAALLEALDRALAAYRQPKVWTRLQLNGMRKDFSWDHAAAEYVTVYKRVMSSRRRTARAG